MSKPNQRVLRPRVQTPEQQAAEQAIRERFQRDKPGLEDLVASGDIDQVYSMGEYWERHKTIFALKCLREQQGPEHLRNGRRLPYSAT